MQYINLHFTSVSVHRFPNGHCALELEQTVVRTMASRKRVASVPHGIRYCDVWRKGISFGLRFFPMGIGPRRFCAALLRMRT